MTFTEAAIEVLRREGKPLHFKKITEIAVRESLLDHVGKVPDDTMADQLTAHCRLPHEDRRLIPILSGTFALTEWGMDEDPTGLDNLLEPPPEGELAYRGRERHPIPSRDMARGAGRQEGRRRREEEGPRPRRFPPPADVAYEILAGAGRPLSVSEIAAQGAERLLMPDAFVRDTNALQSALQEDNRRRESSGRRPLFQVDVGAVTLIAQPEPGERPAVPVARPALSAADARRSGLAALRRRLRECEPATVEHVVCRLLERQGYRDLKVAKRGREHVIYTARRRLGAADVRHAVRILRGSADAGRRDVVELRRDLGHYGAQIGVVATAGEAVREARGEAGAAGQLPVLLLAGEALAEAFAEAGVGCSTVVVPELDEGFFVTAASLAEQEEAARRARREEREQREAGEGRRRPEREGGPLSPGPGGPLPDGSGEAMSSLPREIPAEEVPSGVEALASDDAEGDDEGSDDEGPNDDVEVDLAGVEVPASGEATSQNAGEQGERRRRRRRRRRRGGRGRREGAPGQPGEIDQPRPSRDPLRGPLGGQEAAPAGGAGEGSSGAAGGAGAEPPALAPEPPAAPASPPEGGEMDHARRSRDPLAGPLGGAGETGE